MGRKCRNFDFSKKKDGFKKPVTNEMVAAQLRVVAGLGLTAVEMSSAGAPGNSLSSRPGPDPTEENYQVV